MSVKIHPHLKSFIHSVVISELSTAGKRNRKSWQEDLMRQVQGKILERVEEITTSSDLQRITTEEIKKLQEDFSLTLEIVGRTLQQVPLNLLKS